MQERGRFVYRKDGGLGLPAFEHMTILAQPQELQGEGAKTEQKEKRWKKPGRPSAEPQDRQIRKPSKRQAKRDRYRDRYRRKTEKEASTEEFERERGRERGEETETYRGRDPITSRSDAATLFRTSSLHCLVAW